ncbi:MAG: hypothetical protein JWP15_756 [Alphaproteobacteria bacterium]|nr:hypothetical protein [Alphaproteobacteria bacterium]
MLTGPVGAAIVLSALALALAPAGTGAASARGPGPVASGIELREFFVGGRYSADGKMMSGQAHVLFMGPRRPRHAVPLVLIPGMGQTIANFLSTPDGRPGWAQQFVAMGFGVYLMDQPGRGASAYHLTAYGPSSGQPARFLEQRFTAVRNFVPEAGRPWGWPQASRHSQWPGRGVAGDPVFDQFYASQVESAGGDISSQLVTDAASALLDRIGSAVVITHSQAGAFGWRIGEARPDRVRAIVAIEPSGPPFYSAPPPWGDGDPARMARPYGLTREPLAYLPAVSDPAELKPVQESAARGRDLVRCWRQPEPARKLANLSRVPVLILVSEASYHAGYDHCTAAYLKQAGVRTDFIRLPQIGQFGNGHMMMLEKNSANISAFIGQWLDRQERAPVEKRARRRR